MRVLGKFSEPPHRGYAQHTRNHTWKLHRPVHVARGRDAGNALQPRFDDLARDKLRHPIAAHAEMDDVDLALDALIQRFDQIAEMSARRQFEDVDLRAWR